MLPFSARTGDDEPLHAVPGAGDHGGLGRPRLLRGLGRVRHLLLPRGDQLRAPPGRTQGKVCVVPESHLQLPQPTTNESNDGREKNVKDTSW